MELYSTRLDLWYGEYYYDPYWDEEEEWEDAMMLEKTPANDAMENLLKSKMAVAEKYDGPAIVLRDGKWVVIRSSKAKF